MRGKTDTHGLGEPRGQLPEPTSGEVYKNPRKLQTEDKARPQGGGGGPEDSKTLAFVFPAMGAGN